MGSSFRISKSVTSAITYDQGFNDQSFNPSDSRSIPIVHNLNTLYPVVNIYSFDGTRYNGSMAIRVTDSNTVTIEDYNWELTSDLWHVSVMSSGVGNNSISLPAISVDTQVFGFSGVVKPTVGLSRWYPYGTSTVSKFYASIEVAPTSPVVLQLNKNGSPLGETITFSNGQYKSSVITLDITLTTNDYLTVSIVRGTTGSNLFATVALQSTPQVSPSSIATPKATASNLGLVKVGSGLTVDAGGTISVVPTVGEGLTLGEGLTFDANGNISLVSAEKYFTVFEDNHDFTCHALGTLTSEQVIGMELASKAYLMQGTGYARALTAPTDGAVFFLKINGTRKGIISFDSGSNVGSFSLDNMLYNLQINPGDLMQVIAPATPDATLADVAIVIGGSGALALSLPAATPTKLGLVKIGNGLSVNTSGLLSL